MKNALFAVCVLLLSLPALAEEPQAEMTDEEKMMAVWMAAGTPGEPHAHLAAMTGDWNVSGRFWMEPGQDPVKSNGVASREMILGGRVLAETFKSEFMGMPFEGYGLTGYDNQTNRWWGTWSDTMITGLMLSDGQCTEDMKTCTFMSETLDPMTQQVMHMKSVATFVDHDKEVFETWVIGPTGDEMKTMEFVYTRKE